MKCRSPIAIFLQCLKATWRFLFGRKRTNSTSSPAGPPYVAGALTGITVDTSASSTRSENQEPWNRNWGDASAPLPPVDSPGVSVVAFALPGSNKSTAAEVWRDSLIKQKAAPPIPTDAVEEHDFFGNMEPTLRKPKVVRLRTEQTDDSAGLSSRLAFNAATIPVKPELDWMEDESAGATWEAAIDDLDPRAAKKAKRKTARDQLSMPPAQYDQDTRVRKQLV